MRSSFEPPRRRFGRGTLAAIVNATSLDTTGVTRLTRLVDGGVIRRGDSGDLEVDGAVFQDAAGVRGRGARTRLATRRPKTPRCCAPSSATAG
jgi:hypothetical protein